MSAANPAAALAAGVAALGVELDARQQARLLAYVALIDKWNRAYNLTAVRNPIDMIGRHLLDSLSVLPHLHGTSLLDVGSGAGLPGIPLAIARPAWQVVLLDGNGKKTRFCVHAAGELGLDNVAVEHTRIEDYRPARAFDTVISRAFADLAVFVDLASPLVAADGRLLAMKGRVPQAELAALPPEFRVDSIVPLAVPGVNADRHLVVLRAAAQPG